MDALTSEIEELFQKPPGQYGEADRQLFQDFKRELNLGKVRAAEPDLDSPLGWKVNQWVKKGILVGMRMGRLIPMSDCGPQGCDKDTYPLKDLDQFDNIRVVPGGSSIRDGVYLGKLVVCMPPMYINVGAYVGEGTMVDSHALVGSCAQIGQRCHISAAAQIGGVLEPVGAMPVIIEDEVVVGGNCGVYEGTIVKTRAVLGAGVVLTRSTPVYDIVKGTIHKAEDGDPLVIPEGAVVVPGSRPIRRGGGFAADHGLCLYVPVIVKYRDEKTDSRVELEEFLR